MDLQNKNILKELKKDLLKDKIISYAIKYKKIILSVVVAVIIILLLASIYSYVKTSKAQKNGLQFAEFKEKIETMDYTDVVNLLDSLIKDGNAGYQFVAYMEKASYLVKQGQIDEAKATLAEAKNKIKLSSYYKDMIENIEFMVRFNNIEEDEALLMEDLKNNLNKKSSFYFYTLEMYTALLVKYKHYQEAIDYYSEIIESTDAPSDIKERSKRIRGMLFAYVN